MATSPSPALQPLSSQAALWDFLESGVVIHVATRDADLVPHQVWAIGAAVERAAGTLTLYAATQCIGPTLPNLADNGHIAATFSRPSDHVTLQLKGRVVSVRPAREDERPLLDERRGALSDALATFGVPRATTLRINNWPATALSMTVREMFAQTPGPGAGSRVELDERR